MNQPERDRGATAATIIKWIAVSAALTVALLWVLDVITPPGAIFVGAVAILVIPVVGRPRRGPPG